METNMEEAVKEKECEQCAMKEERLWATISYIGPLSLVTLMAKKDSKLAQYHAKQGLVLFIGEFFAWFPIFGWLLGILIIAYCVLGAIDAYHGRMKRFPILSELAEKVNL